MLLVLLSIVLDLPWHQCIKISPLPALSWIWHEQKRKRQRVTHQAGTAHVHLVAASHVTPQQGITVVVVVWSRVTETANSAKVLLAIL